MGYFRLETEPFLPPMDLTFTATPSVFGLKIDPSSTDRLIPHVWVFILSRGTWV